MASPSFQLSLHGFLWAPRGRVCLAGFLPFPLCQCFIIRQGGQTVSWLVSSSHDVEGGGVSIATATGHSCAAKTTRATTVQERWIWYRRDAGGPHWVNLGPILKFCEAVSFQDVWWLMEKLRFTEEMVAYEVGMVHTVQEMWWFTLWRIYVLPRDVVKLELGCLTGYVVHGSWRGNKYSPCDVLKDVAFRWPDN